MSSIFFVASLLSLLFYWDLQIKVRTFFRYRWARSYVDRKMLHMARLLFALARQYLKLGFKVEREPGLSLPTQFAVVANHQSVVDIIAIKLVLPDHPIRFVAKKELSHGFPAVSAVLRVQQHALIDRRGNRDETMRELDRLSRRIADGICPVVFAEGTRSRTGDVLTFHSGAVRRVLANHQIPVVAVAVDGGYRFSRLVDLSATARNALFRVRVVGVYPVGDGKSSITEAVRSSENAVRTQVEAWHRG